MYALRYLPGAQRFFKKLKEKGLKEAFRRALHHIAQDPYAGERKTGDLAGLYGYDVYYNKTNYEIASASMKRMVNWWWSSWPARERIFMNS